MDLVSLAEFSRLDLRVGKIVGVEDIEGKDRLYKLTIDLGEADNRVILAGIKPWYQKEELLQQMVLVVANLQPKKIGDLLSCGMILCAEKEDGSCSLITLGGEVREGSRVR